MISQIAHPLCIFMAGHGQNKWGLMISINCWSRPIVLPFFLVKLNLTVYQTTMNLCVIDLKTDKSLF